MSSADGAGLAGTAGAIGMSPSGAEEVDGTCGEATAEGSATVECGETDGIGGFSNTGSTAGVEESAGLVALNSEVILGGKMRHGKGRGV